MKRGKNFLILGVAIIAIISLLCFLGCKDSDILANEDYTENLNENIQTASGVLPNGLEYSIYNDIRASITAYNGSASEIVVPERIENKPVFAIGSAAFLNNDKITKVTLPDYILWIEGEAFKNCINLKNINMPSNLTIIKSNAFENCSSLTEISLPSSIEEIRNRAFYSCNSLLNINFPDKDKIEFHHEVFDYTEWIENNNDEFVVAGNAIIKFNLDEDIKDLVIPEGIKTIAIGAVLNNDNIETISFPSTLIEFGDIFSLLSNINTITVDENNDEFTVIDNVLFNKEMTYLLYYPVNNTAEVYTVPEGVIYINSELSNNIKTLILPQSFTLNFADIELLTDITNRYNIAYTSLDSQTRLDILLDKIEKASLSNVYFKISQPEFSSDVEEVLRRQNADLEIIWGYSEE